MSIIKIRHVARTQAAYSFLSPGLMVVFLKVQETQTVMPSSGQPPTSGVIASIQILSAAAACPLLPWMAPMLLLRPTVVTLYTLGELQRQAS